MESAVLLEAEPVGPTIDPRCKCDGGSQHLLCMELHVFVFCIVVSALASGVVVASKSLFERLQETFGRVVYGVHQLPKLKQTSRSNTYQEPDRPSLKGNDGPERAVEVAMERHETVPARYVRAFCGNEQHAWKRWKATLTWRKENDIDSILSEPQPHFHEIRRFFPSYMSGRNRGGHIVVYEKLGDVDMRSLQELGITVPMLLRHWIFVSEYMYRVVQPSDSAQQMTIEDMKGVKIQSLAGKIQDYIKGAAHLARLYYMERCHKTYVVNAPVWFGLAFGMVSPFLSPRTRQKIKILGSDLSVLQDEIDPQFLPVEYGGKNTTPVRDSAEERHLRRLVDAINANAVTGTQVQTASGPKSSNPSRHTSRTPTKRHKRRTKASRDVNGEQAARGAPRLSPKSKGMKSAPWSSEPRTRSRTRARDCSPSSGHCALPFSSAPASSRRSSWGSSDDQRREWTPLGPQLENASDGCSLSRQKVGLHDDGSGPNLGRSAELNSLDGEHKHPASWTWPGGKSASASASASTSTSGSGDGDGEREEQEWVSREGVVGMVAGGEGPTASRLHEVQAGPGVCSKGHAECCRSNRIHEQGTNSRKSSRSPRRPRNAGEHTRLRTWSEGSGSSLMLDRRKPWCDGEAYSGGDERQAIFGSTSWDGRPTRRRQGHRSTRSEGSVVSAD